MVKKFFRESKDRKNIEIVKNNEWVISKNGTNSSKKGDEFTGSILTFTKADNLKYKKPASCKKQSKTFRINCDNEIGFRESAINYAEDNFYDKEFYKKLTPKQRWNQIKKDSKDTQEYMIKTNKEKFTPVQRKIIYNQAKLHGEFLIEDVYDLKIEKSKKKK